MEYFEMLGFKKEPFMDTANPYFFYETGSNEECLHRLEVSLRLGRGLNVILGDVGTGKTTLANTLEQTLLQEEEFVLGKLLDPAFSSEVQFLEGLLRAFGVEYSSRSILDLKNDLKNFLFAKGVEEQKSVILVIDEGQKLSMDNLETLRILLNYQAPQKKLLNIAIFAQPEILDKIREKSNLADRIAFFYLLKPLTQEETFGLIDFRIRRAGKIDSDFFTEEAKELVFEYSNGRPRKIITLCHEAVQEMVIQERSIVEGELIRDLVEKKIDIDQMLFPDLEREEKRLPEKVIIPPSSQSSLLDISAEPSSSFSGKFETGASCACQVHPHLYHHSNFPIKEQASDRRGIIKNFVRLMLKRLNLI